MAILRDPILLSNLQNPETVRKIAQNHRVLIEASEDIVKALKSAKNLNEPVSAINQESFEDLSDSSSSSSSSGSENSPRPSTSTQRITAEQFQRSLAAAQNRNSLANISQRINQGSAISPSTSSGSVPTSSHRFISSSMFMNAMNEVLMANRRANENPAPIIPEATSADLPSERESTPANEPVEDVSMDEDERRNQEERDIEMITNFQPQLRQMEELGLTNKAQNIQALMLCNGHIEAAINLVLTENNSNMMD
jgi:hypothetical protein